MLILTTSAKTLDFESELPKTLVSTPRFMEMSKRLVKKLRGMTRSEFRRMMGVSEDLARVNMERYRQWRGSGGRPAILAYKGDIFREMRPEGYGEKEQVYAQESVRIVSGLYGLVRAYDLIEPYRLEMVTKLAVSGHENLYEFWGETLTESINKDIKNGKHKMVFNLASKAYGKVVDFDGVKAPVVTAEFVQKRAGKLENVGILAKKARGMMMEYLITNRIMVRERVEEFAGGGYGLVEKTEDKLVFARD